MDTTKTANIQFDPIDLSSLKSVLNMYQNKMNESNNQNSGVLLLRNKFGLPLSIASFENRVVGYAFVVINKTGEPEINSYWEKDFYSIEREQDLKFHAQNSCNSLFPDLAARSVKIQNAAERLFNWLQVCN